MAFIIYNVGRMMLILMIKSDINDQNDLVIPKKEASQRSCDLSSVTYACIQPFKCFRSQELFLILFCAST